ncbi:unnamed protein product [Closterium sp. Yama58-4]|nr:unnamed protein product [Closterium sp. Yama58-4]
MVRPCLASSSFCRAHPAALRESITTALRRTSRPASVSKTINGKVSPGSITTRFVSPFASSSIDAFRPTAAPRSLLSLQSPSVNIKLAPFRGLSSVFVFASLLPPLNSSPLTDFPSKATPWECRSTCLTSKAAPWYCRTTNLAPKNRVTGFCTVRSRSTPAKSGMVDPAAPSDAEVPPRVATAGASRPAENSAAEEAERPAEGGEVSAEDAQIAAEVAAKKAKRDASSSSSAAEPDSIPGESSAAAPSAATPAAAEEPQEASAAAPPTAPSPAAPPTEPSPAAPVARPTVYKLRQDHSVLFSEASAYLLGEEGCVLVLQRGDLTKWSVDGRSDAIVNAANERMLGGGGVDGAIHRAAGPALVRECKAVPEVSSGVRCPTGQAVCTGAAELPVKHVIHTVGPIYTSAARSAPLLQSAYVRSMEEARKANVKFIAFPAVSCGIYGYPFPDAAQVSLKALQAACAGFSEVHFILFNEEAMDAYEGAAEDLQLPLLEIETDG